MPSLEDLISPLAAEHQQALSWFREHQGQDVDWPEPLESGILLANKVKGIHKPKGWRYALSVRQVIGGPYPDGDPKMQGDGSWKYRYF